MERTQAKSLWSCIIVLVISCRSSAHVDEARPPSDPSSQFLAALHAGDYAALPGVVDALSARYAANPGDPQRALHLGLAHLWRIAESGRLQRRDPRVLDSLALAHHYLGEAHRLAPEDARIPCWEGSVRRSIGSLTRNDALSRSGLELIRDSAARNPAFGLFCLALPAAHAARHDALFAEALEAQWRSLEICVGQPIDRVRPPHTLPAVPSQPEAIMRACFDGPIAPHNGEGFLLNMGDLLAKAGQPDVAATVYGWAQQAPGYRQWPYRTTLDQRIATVRDRARAFDEAESGQPVPELMTTSEIACAGCHQGALAAP